MDLEAEGINLEFLLLNTLMINAVKVQTVLEDFVKGKAYNSIFCFTETKVDSLDFDPVGVEIFSKHRGKKEKKGGGLIIGHKKDNRIKLEEINVKNNDILALEGTIRGNKIRIILTYLDSTKLKTGKDYEINRKIQKDIVKLIEVEPDVDLVCLGDFNGRLSRLEPNISTDTNGKMIEEWTIKFDLYHLNVTEQCKGTYTYNCKTGKSAIDHVLVNSHLMNTYRGMFIDEEKTQLNISDHCLVRAWFRIGTNNERTKWKKAKFKEIKWISKKEDSLKKC